MPPFASSIARARRGVTRPLRAALSGVLASGVDVVTLLAIVHLTQVAAGLAAAIGCLAGGAANFLVCRRWVFTGTRGSAAAARQLVLYGIICVAGSAVLTGAVVQLATVTIGLSVLAAKCAAAVVVFLGWNYPLSSRLVFTKEPS